MERERQELLEGSGTLRERVLWKDVVRPREEGKNLR